MPRSRTSLSPERILDAAQRLFEQGGVSALSARSLAQELGVSQMAVYRYYSGISDIKSALLDRYFSLQAPSPDVGGAWRAWMIGAFTGFWETLIAHPDTLSLAVETAYVGEDTFGILDGVLRILHEAGFDARAAALIFHTLLSYTIGAAGVRGVAGTRIEAYLEDQGESVSESASEDVLVDGLTRRFAAIPAGDHEMVVAHSTELARFGTRERFVEGLELVIDGVAMQLAATRAE